MTKSLTLKLFYMWLIAVGGGIVAFAFCWWMGIAADCRPNQIDGQCGLSRFVGFGIGMMAAGTIIVIATVVLLIIFVYKWRTRAL